MSAVQRLRPLLRASLIVLAAVATITCGGDSGTGPGDNGGGDTPQTLTISLSVSGAMSSERVVVSGIPENVEGIYAEITVPSGKSGGEVRQESGPAIAVIDRSGDEDELVVPLHPGTPMTGGAVDVSVTNGSNVTSNSVRLDIDPLPAAPGAFAALVDSLQSLLDGWFASTGVSRQYFIDTPSDQLPVYDLPALFVFNLVDHPDNLNSLRALADGDIPIFDDGEPLERDVLDAVVAASGLQDMVSEKLEFFGGIAPPEIPDPPAAGAAYRASRGAAQECIQAPRFDIGPNNCALLAEIMSYQSELELAAASAVEKYKNDLVNGALTLMSYGRAAKIASGIASSLWAVEGIEEGHKGLYPSQFISDATTFTVDKETFPEDFTTPGKWSEFKVSAISNGWNFEKRAKEAFEKLYGAATSGLPANAPAETFREKYDGMVKNQLSKDAKKKIINNDDLDLEYCAQTWHAIDCTGLPHSSGTSNSLKYDSDQLTYEPSEVGTATLEVGTEPVFGLGKETRETKQVTTERLEVNIDPFQATRDVEEVQAFFARVTGEDQSVDWSITWPAPDNTGVFSPDGNDAEVFTPANPWMTPIEVKAKSTSNTGLRKDKVDSDPREDTALITWAGGPQIRIVPGYKCLSPGDPPFKFTEQVTGIEDYTVVWKVESGYGSIDQNGWYTPPPAGQADDVITAELEEVPGVKDDASVRVGACTCNYLIDFIGVGSHEGGDIAYQFTDLPDGFHVYTFFLELGNTEAVIGMSLGPTDDGPAPRPGQTGTYGVSLSYLPAGGGEGWITGEESGVTLNILEHTETYMIANLAGTLQQGEEGNQRFIVVTGSFRAGRWLDRWPCE